MKRGFFCTQKSKEGRGKGPLPVMVLCASAPFFFFSGIREMKRSSGRRPWHNSSPPPFLLSPVDICGPVPRETTYPGWGRKGVPFCAYLEKKIKFHGPVGMNLGISLS